MAQPARADVLALINSYVAALNAQDPARLMALFTEDTRHVEPVGGPVRTGESLRAFFESTANPGWSVALHGPPMVVGDHAAFVLAITLDGTPPVTFLCVDTIRVDTDTDTDSLRIAEFAAYPDLEAIAPADTPR